MSVASFVTGLDNLDTVASCLIGQMAADSGVGLKSPVAAKPPRPVKVARHVKLLSLHPWQNCDSFLFAPSTAQLAFLSAHKSSDGCDSRRK